jgi:hypothetical protein
MQKSLTIRQLADVKAGVTSKLPLALPVLCAVLFTKLSPD